MVMSFSGYTSNNFISISFLKKVRFEAQTCAFIQAACQVHVLYGLSAGAFQQVVYSRMYYQFAANLFQLYHTFVSIYHLFQEDGFLAYVSERMVLVIGFIKVVQLLLLHVAVDLGADEYPPRKIT